MTVCADLHNHSCLSPCGDLYASPSAMAHTARRRGVDLMALTDHNSTRNTPAFAAACRREGLMALFGTETTSREEVHILSLYPTVEAAQAWGQWVYERLPEFEHDPERFGDQVVVDVDENILDFEARYLIPAIDATIDEIRQETLSRGGLIIPAHIDRTTNSMLSQLGFLPDLAFSALEVTTWPPVTDPRGHTLICDSDAHFIDDVAQRTFSFQAEIEFGSSQEEIFTALSAALAQGTVSLSIAQ
ncbi:MAG TPA: PHP domain-containing protein [Alkalispirochaeta sp.]|nr:PHP domain-containing protein [Alkalispirochaeta sp.]